MSLSQPRMYKEITEKDYPIELVWVLKPVFAFLTTLVITVLLFMFGYYNLYLLIFLVYLPINVVIIYLRRQNFHYVLGPKYFLTRQGILSKKERNVPYGVVQNVFVNRDLVDRILGLATLSVENASFGGGASLEPKTKFFGSEKKEAENIGSSGNKITIPGLKVVNAEALKKIILSKMKENLTNDEKSGL